MSLSPSLLPDKIKTCLPSQEVLSIQLIDEESVAAAVTNENSTVMSGAGINDARKRWTPRSISVLVPSNSLVITTRPIESGSRS